MGLYKTSNFSIFTFIRLTLCCVYLVFKWKSLQNDDVTLELYTMHTKQFSN